MKGLIALDIDGTITSNLLSIPEEVSLFLKELTQKDWSICLVTGRSLSFATPAIKSLDFPYFLALLNGALILKMPEGKVIKQHYIAFRDILGIEKISEGEPTDFVIYANDVCYYRKEHYSEEILSYLLERAKALNEVWKPVSTFSEIEEFPSIKCIGPYDVIQRMAAKTMQSYEIAMPVIRDPRKEGYFVGLGTHLGVNKGIAVNDLRGDSKLVIAAGDDLNDIPMLQAADIRIVMESAPKEMHEIADILSKPASQNGIILALGSIVY